MNCNSIIINTKITDRSNQSSFFFILSVEKSSEMFPKHNRTATISESFVLNLWVSVLLTKK